MPAQRVSAEDRTNENSRIPGEGNLPQVRPADPARLRRVQRRRSRRRGEEARRQGLGGEGADPRRRPWQGRWREAGEVGGGGSKAGFFHSGNAIEDAPDRPRGPESAPPAGGR